MKKILIAEESSKFVSVSSIDNDDLVLGVLNQELSLCQKGEVFILMELNPSESYRLVSLATFTAWEFGGKASAQELIKSICGVFDFYLLDDWKEIKEFIK